MRRLAAAIPLLTLLVGCVGDLGADRGLPNCNSQPIDLPGFTPSEREDVELADRIGHRFRYTRPDGARVTFLFGVPSDAGAGLPRKERIPLASLGVGQLRGQGVEWAFTWSDVPPCDPMAVTGTGITRSDFITHLGLSGVIPRAEEEGEGGIAGEAEGIEEELEEAEGETDEGVLPPGGPSVEFVAVFETASDVSDLDSIAKELMDSAPNNIAISPITCWKGLPQHLGVPRDRYVAAVVALTRNELDFVVDRVGRTPIFSGQLRARCND